MILDVLLKLFILGLVLDHSYIVTGRISHIKVPKDLQCSSNEYFDPSGLICTRCNPLSSPISSTTHIGIPIGCKCDKSSIQETNTCETEEIRSGLCLDITCTPECSQLSQPAAMDSSICTICSSGNETKVEAGVKSNYDEINNDCTCNNPPPSSNQNSIPVLNRKLIEIYHSETGEPIGKKCMQCPENTAVITNNLLKDGETYFSTAGSKFLPNSYVCVYCPDPDMYFDADYQCRCANGLMVVGEASIGPQKCLRYTPTLSSEYDKVQFPFIRLAADSKETSRISLNSIIFSHYYLEAASECEFPTGPSLERSLNACQTLANLCIMTYYDDTSIPCRQFQFVENKRATNYHGNDDWKTMMPWLYYTDEVDDIVDDKGIQMTMSFKAEKGYENIMKFKLAKYGIDGEFFGIEDLTNQFMYCTKSAQSDKKGEQGLRFGHSKSDNFQCSLDSIINGDMFFYDMYLVDADCEDSTNGENCLYPVPVLNQNYLEKGGSLPNRNQFFGDEINDKYSRRFFLFDNLSGMDGDGLKVIRYASKIKLQTTIQSQTPGKIHPPKLIIEYDEREISSFNHDYNGEILHIFFNIEYTMITKKYWATVEVLSGFVSAIALVLWIFRVCNSFNRHRNTSPESEDIKLLQFLIHAIMVGIHSFVVVFFQFLFLLCFYWYIFIKLQDAVFLLLPPDNGYEYLFYTVFVHCLCWGQTMYIFYIIYRQCQTDIFLIDWEKPKIISDDISIWRTVLVANEFNKMQSLRKSSIEINLVLLTIIMSQTSVQSGDNSENENVIIRFANNCFLWFLVSSFQRLVRFIWYDRYCSEPLGQRFIDLCTLTKISIFIMDERYHGFYLHCRSPYEFADCGMEKLCNDMKREANGAMNNRGLDSPGCPPHCQTFEIYSSEIFQRQFRKPFTLSESWRRQSQQMDNMNDRSLYLKTEAHSFLVSFIEQSPPPQQQGLKRVFREPMLMDKILGVTPDNRSKHTACIFYPDQATWAQDYAFLNITFLGVESQLLLHDILVYNMIDIFFLRSPFLSMALTYLVSLVRFSVRQYFGSKNLFRKAFLDERFKSML